MDRRFGDLHTFSRADERLYAGAKALWRVRQRVRCASFEMRNVSYAALLVRSQRNADAL
ncbi:MAG: hypothetical protein WBF42_09580 [Terracidiphilus sp.]